MSLATATQHPHLTERVILMSRTFFFCVTVLYRMLPCNEFYCRVLPCTTTCYRVLPCVYAFATMLPCVIPCVAGALNMFDGSLPGVLPCVLQQNLLDTARVHISTLCVLCSFYTGKGCWL